MNDGGVRDDELARVVEEHVAGTLAPPEAQELVPALARSEDLRRDFAAQVRMAHLLRTHLRPVDDEAVWARVERALAAGPADGARLADAVQARLRRRRVVRWAAPAAVAAALAIAAVALVGEERRPPPRPALTATAPAAPVEAPPPVPPPTVWEPLDDVIYELPPDRARTGSTEVRYGRPARCPPHGPATRCFQAVRQGLPFPMEGSLSVIDRVEGLFPYHPDALLVFDYWLGEPLGQRGVRVTSYFRLAGQKAGHEYTPGIEAEQGRWARAVMPLAAFRDQRGSRPPQAGAMVTAFNIACNVAAEDVFFIANLRVVRGRRVPAP